MTPTALLGKSFMGGVIHCSNSGPVAHKLRAALNSGPVKPGCGSEINSSLVAEGRAENARHDREPNATNAEL
jgi:hypothetical protein